MTQAEYDAECKALWSRVDAMTEAADRLPYHSRERAVAHERADRYLERATDALDRRFMA